MAKAIKHTVEGLTDTRKSPRIYTHATVVTMTDETSIRNALRQFDGWLKHNAKSNWEFNLRMANGTDDLYTRYAAQYGDGRKEREMASYAEIIDEHDGSFAKYVEAHREQTLAHRTKPGTWVLSWHMSLDAAIKFVRSTRNDGYYSRVDLREVTREEKLPA